MIYPTFPFRVLKGPNAVSKGIPERFRPLIHPLAVVGLLIGIHVPTAETHHANHYQTIATIKRMSVSGALP